MRGRNAFKIAINNVKACLVTGAMLIAVDIGMVINFDNIVSTEGDTRVAIVIIGLVGIITILFGLNQLKSIIWL